MNYGTLEGKPDARPMFVPARSRRMVQGPVLKTIVGSRRFSNIKRAANVTTAPVVQRKPKSFVYTMLNPRSKQQQAVVFKFFISTVIVLDLVAFILSTDPDLTWINDQVFATWEAIDSWIFLTEYILRLITVNESEKHRSMGPIKGRLSYMVSTPAMIDLVATMPYFVEKCSGYDLPTLTYLRSFRLLRILKTQGFIEAIKSVCRVFRYNSEILYVAVWIGLGLVLVTAVLMYYLRPRNEDNPQFKSLPATLFLAAMMLTGQGGPEGALPWYTSSVVLLTGAFSIGMFAIPASMLTWGFEGEAERLAKLRRKKMCANPSNGNNQNDNEITDDWSFSSSDYSTDEEYLNTIAGFEDEDDSDEDLRAYKAFKSGDTDGDGNLSLREYMALSRRMESANDLRRSTKDFNNPLLARRLEVLEQKVEENSKKLDKICQILEGMKVSRS